MIRHGSSLDLISKSTSLLNEEFAETDPEKDFEKWNNLGARTYFFSVIEPSGVMGCTMRIQLDGDFSSPPSPWAYAPTDVCTKRVVVDYIVTIEELQGKGYASYLLR